MTYHSVPLPRLFIDHPLHSDDTFLLPSDAVRHAHVLRLQNNDTLLLFNGKGGQYRATLLEISKHSMLARIDAFDAIEREPSYRVTLAQGIASGAKMDWLIEKSVELGATGFVPLAATRSVVRLTDERAEKRIAHWQGVIRAACEQCGRNQVPAVTPVQSVPAWLKTLSTTPVPDEWRLMLDPRADATFAALPVIPPSQAVTVLIGPEGGFAPAEEEAARAYQFMPLRLGTRVLRTETAGIAILAALAARWGDL